MSPHEKPEKRKPDKAKSETAPERLHPGLERRLNTAKPDKNQQTSKSVSLKELTTIAKSAKHKFTLAELEIIEYAHVEKTRNSSDAIKLANAVEREIAAQLRNDDLIADLGAGKFLVYLAETAKVEATMVLERLTRHICKKTQKRTIAPQISLCYRFLDAETITGDSKPQIPTEKDERFDEWLKRYRTTPTTSTGATGQGVANESIAATDSWKDSCNVLIKQFKLPSEISQEKKQNLTETFLNIQENGLALFPRLFDFYIDDKYLSLVLEPSCQYPAEQQNSLRTAHTLLISVCDLFLHFDSVSIPPPTLSEQKFKNSASDQEKVYDSLEDYLVESLLSDAKREIQDGSAKAFESFASLMSKLSEKVGTDECFIDAQEQLKNISSKKNNSNTLQKVRATLKRHEERLRRSQSSTTGEN